jgi:hypothetical protein
MFVCFVKLSTFCFIFSIILELILKKVPFAKELCLHEQFEFEFECEKKVLIVVGHLIDELISELFSSKQESKATSISIRAILPIDFPKDLNSFKEAHH